MKAKTEKMKPQVAALAYRVTDDGELSVALVSSRETARWVLPKGWPVRDMADADAAAKEALEEAGIVGTPERDAIGTYTYTKQQASKTFTCRVDVFPMSVDRSRSKWREKGQRHIVWVPTEHAALLVDEPDLKALLLDFGRWRRAQPVPA